MKLKLDESGHVVVTDGKPVYIYDDKREVAFDAPATVATISRLNGEAKQNRERYEAAETKLKVFDGIEDAEAARKAIDTLKNIDEGKLLSAGKVEEIKTAAKKAAEETVAAANKANAEALAKTHGELDKRTSELNSYMIGGGFSRSKLITDPEHRAALVIPPDIAEARFGRNFKVEDGKVVGYDNAGNKIFSRAKPGEIADFDEALETLVDAYPNKNQILKGANGAGSGARPNSGGGLTNEALSKLSPVERMNAVRAAAR